MAVRLETEKRFITKAYLQTLKWLMFITSFLHRKVTLITFNNRGSKLHQIVWCLRLKKKIILCPEARQKSLFCYQKKKTLFKNVNLTVAVAPKASTASAENHLGKKKKKKPRKAVHIAQHCFVSFTSSLPVEQQQQLVSRASFQTRFSPGDGLSSESL